MRQMLFGTLLMFGLAAFAQAPAPFQNLSPTGTDGVATSQGQGRGTVLFSTFGGIVNPNPVTVSSQNFLDLPPFFTAAADDFTISDLGWTIAQVEVRGGYEIASGPAQSVNVYILGNSGVLPDTTNLSAGAIYAAENLTPAEPTPGDFVITLPGGGVTLQGGTYWLVVQANMAIGSGGQWNWTESALVADAGTFNGNPSAWLQEASAFFAGGACAAAWGDRVTTCGVTTLVGANPEFDLAFELTGTVLTAGVTVDPLMVNTTEDGSTVDYDVTLNAPPSGGETVTITPASNDVTEGTVSGALNFTAANWNIPQTVTVTPGASGDGNDGDVAYTIDNNVGANLASGYSAVSAPSVAATNVNIDGVKVITVNPTSGLNVSEDGTLTATFDIALTQVPTAGTVSVNVNADANTEVSNGGPFGPTVAVVMSNTTPATVTVRGIDNMIDAPDAPFTITTDAAVAAGDPGYNGVNPPDVTGTVLDDDTAGITVTGGPLATDETGAMDSFDVVLDTEPTADVTVNLVSSDTTEAVPTASLLFTSANWNTPQTVTVTGQDDDIDDGNVAYQINTQPAVSSDPAYSGIDAADVAGTNADDGDTVGVTVAPTSGLTTAEADVTGSASFTVVLDSEPLFDVTIPFSTDNNTEGQVGTAMGGPFSDSINLTFTSANWNVPQTVWLIGVDDILGDGDTIYNIISGDPTSNDPLYDALTAASVADVQATNLDDPGEVCMAFVELFIIDANTIKANGVPGCVFDLVNLNGSLNPVDWTVVVDDVVIGVDGMATIVVPGGLIDDSLYGAASSDTSALIGSVIQTVPTLGEWGLIAFVTLLAMAGIYMMRRRRMA